MLDAVGRFELRGAADEGGVAAAGCDEFLVAAALGDLVTVEDDDLVGVSDLADVL